MYFHVFQHIHYEFDTKTYRSIAVTYSNSIQSATQPAISGEIRLILFLEF